jgi:hypothetical protein
MAVITFLQNYVGYGWVAQLDESQAERRPSIEYRERKRQLFDRWLDENSIPTLRFVSWGNARLIEFHMKEDGDCPEYSWRVYFQRYEDAVLFALRFG